ncbi:hypothetical protein SAMN06265349_101709 [Flavobacterium resistens]|uniref:Uncharacterized protein n=1 Tax=Flavobacterium resistens TaxID=443612 RepID=A0A521B6U7_9FLAO|nr:hypothetical protein [Flavobacterium resistens]MRX70289.1 hypothetical protein [Flavobacterium resistens]SMO42390.1 hypothetical protein SAMN06265349_101709 [Flavobacterium resistens]
MKIVLVLNTIIAQREKISNVIPEENEFYFLYDNKYKWSIKKILGDWDDEFIVDFFPDAKNEIIPDTIDQIASNRKWGIKVNYARYSTKEIGTKEAYETFKDLYDILFNVVYGIDDIFNDIIDI